jgi:glycosyltransferase involved in cell wall biosynthesis
MACGCPVIASRNTGAEDLFSNGQEGFIVPARDADALAAAMQRLADDPDLRNQMSVASVRRVAESGGWDDYGRNVKGVFSKLVSDPSRFKGTGNAAS